MKTLTIKKLEGVLRTGLHLRDPEFHLERAGTRIFGSVVSRSFSGLRDHQRQTQIWDLLEDRFGQESWRRIGMLLAYTPDEWNVDLEGHHTNGHGKSNGHRKK